MSGLLPGPAREESQATRVPHLSAAMINRVRHDGKPSRLARLRVARLEPATRRSALPRTWKHTLESAVGRYPLVTVLAGLGVGLLLGWFIKRSTSGNGIERATRSAARHAT